MIARGLASCVLLAGALLAPRPAHASGADPGVAARFINALGIDLLSGTLPDSNAVLSPYSIQCALAMTWAGADGDTRSEMARVLHYPADEGETHASLAGLTKALDEIAAETAARNATGGEGDPVTFMVANRLFGQAGYGFRASFTNFIQAQYDAPLQLMDFQHDYERARGEINTWVEEQTRQKIRGLIPPGGLNDLTRLVLVNAIYLKAPWQFPFSESATGRLPFYTAPGRFIGVPSMRRIAEFGYVKRAGYTVITMPYTGDGLHFLVLLPDSAVGLRALERRLTPEMLAAESGAARPTDVLLQMPRFKVEPPAVSLGSALQSLGMKTAFDDPPGSANFDRMAPRRPPDYLYISKVFHKTFLAIDERGTEAAAATAVVMAVAESLRPKPIEIKVDRPFLFAIQHRETGACLFLGRITDPR